MDLRVKPNQIATNNDTNLLKIVAIVTMLIDHAGKMLFPQYRILRIIGRLAFPLFAYCVAVGCVYTHSILDYMKRVLLMGLISQPIYAFSMAHTTPAMYDIPFRDNPVLCALNYYLRSYYKPSILFTLLFGIALIWSIKEKQYVFMFGLVVLLNKTQSAFDYGAWGVGLMVVFYLTLSNTWMAAVAATVYILWKGLSGFGYTFQGISFGIETFAVFAVPLICLPIKSNLKLNKWVFYWFYPVHLMLIYLLDRFCL